MHPAASLCILFPMQITISLSEQKLILEGRDGNFLYVVSTAAKGAGEQQDSGCTPRGRHLVRARFGVGLAAGAVFQGRRFTGEYFTQALADAYPDRDWMLSRILWLGGMEPGHNQGGDVDSFRRFIYIHGTPDTEPMGEPASYGCIRMRNADVIDLFDRVPVATPVIVVE